MMSIGFIGVGTMGNPMAKNLLKKGFPVTVYDIVPEKIESEEYAPRVRGEGR